jgi:hypothetical protein
MWYKVRSIFFSSLCKYTFKCDIIKIFEFNKIKIQVKSIHLWLYRELFFCYQKNTQNMSPLRTHKVELSKAKPQVT